MGKRKKDKNGNKVKWRLLIARKGRIIIRKDR